MGQRFENSVMHTTCSTSVNFQTSVWEFILNIYGHKEKESILIFLLINMFFHYKFTKILGNINNKSLIYPNISTMWRAINASVKSCDIELSNQDNSLFLYDVIFWVTTINCIFFLYKMISKCKHIWLQNLNLLTMPNQKMLEPGSCAQTLVPLRWNLSSSYLKFLISRSIAK